MIIGRRLVDQSRSGTRTPGAPKLSGRTTSDTAAVISTLRIERPYKADFLRQRPLSRCVEPERASSRRAGAA